MCVCGLAVPTEDHLILVDQLTEVPQLVQGQRGARLSGHGSAGVLVFTHPQHPASGHYTEGLHSLLDERQFSALCCGRQDLTLPIVFSQRRSKERREGGMH